MKVGIIIYSQTGNTLEVAEKIAHELRVRKVNVEIEKIEVDEKSIPRKNPFNITKSPDISKYDVVILGSLVEGFSLSPVMKKYIESIESFESKDIYCYVTHFFPFSWLGGKSAMKQMRSEVECHIGSVVHTGIVDWKSNKRAEEIDTIVQNFADLITTL